MVPGDRSKFDGIASLAAQKSRCLSVLPALKKSEYFKKLATADVGLVWHPFSHLSGY